MIKATRDGRSVFHWPASLKELIRLKKKYGPASDSNWRDDNEYTGCWFEARNAADDWQICACGSLCQAIPRRNHDNSGGEPLNCVGAPMDATLAKRGLKFMELIHAQEFEGALEMMQKIEDRATVILKKMGVLKKTYGKPIKI